MKRRILLIALTAVALVAGTTASHRPPQIKTIPWCPPYCSN